VHDPNRESSGAGAVSENASPCGIDRPRTTFVTPKKYHTRSAPGSQRSTCRGSKTAKSYGAVRTTGRGRKTPSNGPFGSVSSGRCRNDCRRASCKCPRIAAGGTYAHANT